MMVNAAAGLAGAGLNAFAAYQAAQAQREAAKQAAQARAGGLQIATNYLSPYAETGKNAMMRYANLAGVNGADAATAAMKDFTTSPGYEFRLNEGQRNLDNSAAARGSLLSGQQAKAVTRYGQDYASNEYGNYMRNFLPLIQGGQSAASSLAGFATGGGEAQAGGYLGAGDATAAMWGGLGNAGNQAINNVLYSYQQDQQMGNLADLFKMYGIQ
jgi:hypothetical protein